MLASAKHAQPRYDGDSVTLSMHYALPSKIYSYQQDADRRTHVPFSKKDYAMPKVTNTQPLPVSP